MQKRPTEEQCYDIIKFSVQYLQDYGMHENALFRESKSQHDIRSLKAQICEGRSRRQLGDLDCHVLGGVLVSALKDLPSALLFEIQENLQEAADLTDGSDECLDRIAAYLSQLPAPKIEVARLLFTYLHDLAAAPANDANVVHLMIIFAPLFCRPANTAHMSIRHVDMLRQLRPLLQITLENNTYIMRHVVVNSAPPMVAAAKVSSSSSGVNLMTKGDGDHKPSKLKNNMGLNLSINIGHSKDAKGSSPMAAPNPNERADHSDQSPRQNMGTSMDIDNDLVDVNSHSFAAGLSGFFPSSHGSATPLGNINTHSWEWKMFDSLVLSRVESLVHKSDLVAVWNSNSRVERTGKLDGESKGSEGNSRSISAVTQVVDGNVGDSKMEQDDDEIEATATSQYFHQRRLSDRREMIAECKQLRQEIQRFEEQWILEHKRSPKPHERGNMQPAYARYKDIKKNIRDNAAIDIQRIIRGTLTRRGKNDSTPMEMDQQQVNYVQQSQFSHLQKRPASADGYHSHSHSSSPLAKALAGVGGDVSLSTSLPLTRSVSDDGPGIHGGSASIGSNVMLEADSKSTSILGNMLKTSHHNAWLSQDQETGSGDNSSSKSHGNSSGSKQISGNRDNNNSDNSSDNISNTASAKYNDETQLLFARYRESLESKKSLKKMLKKFDDDFVAKKGRAPKKVDKEVMRPQYQKYHEVRGELEKLKTEIIKKVGHFPKDLEESKGAGAGGEDEGGSTSARGGGLNTSMDSSATRNSLEYTGSGGNGGGGGGDNTEEGEGDDDDDHISGTSISSTASNSNQGMNSSSSSGGGEGNRLAASHTLGGLDELNHEKKHLHLYLKSFEKEFNRANGRHVMHPEDILPVAKEYQRYKELKKILKDYRTSSTSAS